MQDTKSIPSSFFSEREPLINPPPTIWTKFNARYRFGKWILVGLGLTGIIAVMFITLGVLDIFSNNRYRNQVPLTSIGKTVYDGDSWGTATEGHFDMGGKGDGTYYDPGVGHTACGTLHTASDYVVALNEYDYGQHANPNNAPVCGACIMVTGPLGTQKATIQDKCPKVGCGRGSLDLSPAVFNKIGDPFYGRIAVSWTHC
ncbi:hypothetical protein BDB01DRAFT_726295 [Pilobolus umbonatus]|nr:hypothetical protein BDB01DRAFT_726295 [Pilobolus umbonatus]